MAFLFSFGKKPAEAPPPVKFRACGEDDRTRNINLLKARRSPAFEIGTRLLHRASLLNATVIQVDRSSTTAVNLEVDGIWHPLPPIDAETGRALANAYKQLAGLPAQDIRWRQSGQFSAVIGHANWDCTVVGSGIAGGERTQLLLGSGNPEFENLSAMSVRAVLCQKMREVLARDAGFVLFSAPPESGMIELLEAAVRDSDRFQRSYYLLENSRRPRPGIENVATRKYDGSALSLEGLLRSIAKEHPDVLIVPELTEAETVDTMAAQPAQDRLALAGIAANTAPETLLRVLALRCNASRFTGEVSAVANARLLRKLCVTCRQPYIPPPQVTMQLGLPLGETQALFRPSGTILGERDEPIPCPSCFGLGYRGRAAVVEWLEVNDAMRATLLAGSEDHLAELTRQARQSGMTSHLQEAGLLAAQGITSVQEIYRVLSVN